MTTKQTETNIQPQDTQKIGRAEELALILVLASIFILTLLFFVIPKRAFSDNENRYLAKPPAISILALTSGRLTAQVSDYLSDHFPGRDAWLEIQSETSRLSGKREINQVYIANDNALIDTYKKPVNTKRITDAFIRMINDAPKVNTFLMLVPTALEINAADLPADCYDKRMPGRQQAVIDEIYAETVEAYELRKETAESADGAGTFQTVDVAGALRKAKETIAQDTPLYFRTDHHWTMRGAYEGYLAYCKEAGFEPYELSAYQAETVTNSFYGTTWSKLCDSYFKPDDITVYSDSTWNLTVTYSDTGEESTSVYNKDYLQEKDKYSMFLNNLHPLVTIINRNLAEDKNEDGKAGAVAVVKDSYANCMIPFLINHYRTIYVFDTRYYTDGVTDFIAAHPDIDTVLLLYNLGTMDSDTGIGGIY